MSDSAFTTPISKVSFTAITQFAELYTDDFLSPLREETVPEKHQDTPHLKKLVEEDVADKKPEATIHVENADEDSNENDNKLDMESDSGLVTQADEVTQAPTVAAKLGTSPIKKGENKENLGELADMNNHMMVKSDRLGEWWDINNNIYTNCSEDAVHNQKLFCAACDLGSPRNCQWERGVGVRMRGFAESLKLKQPELGNWQIRWNLYKFYHHLVYPGVTEEPCTLALVCRTCCEASLPG
jgi:hypothetical protein